MRRALLAVLLSCLAGVGTAFAGGLQGARELSDIYTGSYALVIGASDYPETRWDSLPGVGDDIEQVTSLLEQVGFTVEQVPPPLTRANIQAAVEQFFDSRGAARGHQLLVYYAGHGLTLRDQHDQLTGFIIPVDAPLPPSDLPAEQYTDAIEMSWLEAVAARPRVRAKHVLFMFDSCFSGSVFQRKRGGGQRSALIDYLASQDVRQFISSGTHRQEVPDRSVFARMFREALAGRGDLNRDGYITGTELGQFLRETVSNITRARQTPQFARMSQNGVDYGEFLFLSPIGSHGDVSEPGEAEDRMLPGLGNRFRNCGQCPEMTAIPAGTAVIGSQESEPGRAMDEPVQKLVQLESSFAMSVFEITEKQWLACFREGGCSRWIPLTRSEADLPVAGVSWEDAREYTQWLSEKTGYDYRLPTAVEWEYAARAGSTSARPWGEELGDNRANCRGCGSPWDGKGVAPVGSFEANGFGLHDTMGNLWEWVRDCDSEASETTPAEGRYYCLLKGGSFGTSPVSVRSAAIGRYPAGRAQANFGFRVTRQP